MPAGKQPLIMSIHIKRLLICVVNIIQLTILDGIQEKPNLRRNDMSQGIDWGLGQKNIDTETGIRYGVIHFTQILQSWMDESEPYYPPVCPACGSQKKSHQDVCCECDCDDTSVDDTPSEFILSNEKYQASQSAEDTDVFVIKSWYYTYATFCSPCAPGACSLMEPLEDKIDNNKAYCFGHDFFESGQAPYPVYEVTTGKQVHPE